MLDPSMSGKLWLAFASTVNLQRESMLFARMLGFAWPLSHLSIASSCGKCVRQCSNSVVQIFLALKFVVEMLAGLYQ